MTGIEIKLISFQHCPNAAVVRSHLISMNIIFEEIKQDVIPEHSGLRLYSSPTLFKGDKLIFGCEVHNDSLSCTFGIPTRVELQKMLTE